MFKELDVVKLRNPIPKHRLKVGSIGAIVHVWNQPDGPFEVEFVASNGTTDALLTLSLDQIEPA